VSPDVLRQYVGVCQLAANAIITMTLDGDQLETQMTGQPKFPVFPEADNRFFLKVVDAQFEFVKDASGKVTRLILHQGGQDASAPKIR
jgi:Domain of unknown function (DUF3471)